MDYSNAYRQDGTHDPAHQLWCSALSLLGLLLAALPGEPRVQSGPGAPAQNILSPALLCSMATWNGGCKPKEGKVIHFGKA